MTKPGRNLHPFAVAMEWVAKITTVGLEMVLPAIGGAYFDRRLGTEYWALVGVLVGVSCGLWHLILMTRTGNRPNNAGRED